MPKREPLPGLRERRARQAAVLWGKLTLGGIGILALFVLWHLSRRGRLIRDRLGPPRPHGLSADETSSSAT
jgi:hypothetical protein